MYPLLKQTIRYGGLSIYMIVHELFCIAFILMALFMRSQHVYYSIGLVLLIIQLLAAPPLLILTDKYRKRSDLLQKIVTAINWGIVWMVLTIALFQRYVTVDLWAREAWMQDYDYDINMMLFFLGNIYFLTVPLLVITMIIKGKSMSEAAKYLFWRLLPFLLWIVIVYIACMIPIPSHPSMMG